MYECHYRYKDRSDLILNMSCSSNMLLLTDQKTNFYFKAVKKETTKFFFEKTNNIFVFIEGYFFNKDIISKGLNNNISESELIKNYISNMELTLSKSGWFFLHIDF